jgi:hypothetical protein
MLLTLYLSNLFLIIAFLASITVFKRPNSALYLRLFPIFLFVIIILALIISYLSLQRKSNLAIANLFTTIEFCFYFFVFNQIIVNKRLKKIIFYVLLIYPVIAILNIFLIQKVTVFNTMTYSLGCLLIVACCVFYFLELFQSPYPIALSKEPTFWICSGLLFYFACTFPLFGLINFLSDPSKKIIQGVTIISNLLDVLLYSSFTIAFLCRIKIRKSMS